MEIAIINGPNLNLLGAREPEKYGTKSFGDYLQELHAKFPSVALSYFQSNVEGELVNAIQKVNESADGAILNAAGYTHTSVAIRDAVAAISIPVVEVHISNVYAREEFRHHSFVSPVAAGVIVGHGLFGYELALRSLANRLGVSI